VRAVTISAHGGLDQLELRSDVPAPTLARPDDVRIRVRAAALNHLDLFVVEGLPGVTITPPWILGGDAAGVVEEVGPDVRHVKAGDTVVINPGISDRSCEYCREGEHSLCVRFRLLGEHLPGTLAEQVVVPAPNVRAIPGGVVAIEEAAAFSLATLTAWRMVVSRARVTAADQVLIWGIGGGVAQAALQIAKLLGAFAVVTSGSDAKLESARALGADAGVNHATANVVAEVRRLTGGRAADVVVDSVGERTWPDSLRALRRGGRLVVCGATTGPMVGLDLRRLFWHQWTLLGSTMGSRKEYREIVRLAGLGRLWPVVDRVVPMDQAPAALARLAAGEQFGKLVIEVSR